MSKKDKLFLALLFAVSIAFAAFLGWQIARQNDSKIDIKNATHDSLTATYTHDGDIIRIYSVTDSDSGIEYLVSDHGGITPRLEQNA